jgi:transcriptional regulator with XRE-family HTH domain
MDDPRVVPIRASELIRLRLSHGWTQEAFAAEVGCDVRTVQRAERKARAKITTVREFAQALGCKIADLLQPTTEERHQDHLPAREYVVFGPNAPRTSQHGYLGSRLIKSGTNDLVAPVSSWVPLEAAKRPLIPVVRRGDAGMLRIQFNHHIDAKTLEGWWAGVIYVGVGIGGNPIPIDITPYRSLCIEARATSTYPDKRTGRLIPLRVRLEDNSLSTANFRILRLVRSPYDITGSGHQSSSWSRKPLLLTEYFHEHRCDLNKDFAWSKDAWAENFAAPNCRAIKQIIVGQDETILSCEGVIEIRRIRFSYD